MTTTTLQHVSEATYAAANPEHAWDLRAIDWPLTPHSTVIEVGGYKGRWAFQIATRYNPRLFVFEPQPWAASCCAHLMPYQATVETYALGDRDGTVAMSKWGTDGCAIEGGGDEWAPMREMSAAFDRLGITTIDLMLINIEGYEFTLIPHMIERGMLPTRLMVQFHDADREPNIWSLLSGAGYRVLWTYPALTAWERAA